MLHAKDNDLLTTIFAALYDSLKATVQIISFTISILTLRTESARLDHLLHLHKLRKAHISAGGMHHTSDMIVLQSEGRESVDYVPSDFSASIAKSSHAGWLAMLLSMSFGTSLLHTFLRLLLFQIWFVPGGRSHLLQIYGVERHSEHWSGLNGFCRIVTYLMRFSLHVIVAHHSCDG